ncbi:MAG: folylpolyglutamate synthase/dihydrofolate synthase family protein [Bryobacter sp.]
MPGLAEAVRYLYSLGNEVKTVKLGLERIQTLLAALGHPERACPVVHIAGTNGKGSVSAMVESTLRHAGFHTGLYTSPHLVTPQERIRVQCQNISEEEFLAAFAAVHQAAERLLADGAIDLHPTYFETITAMGFWHFAQQGVERLVLEVGLGGRLDATNVVDPLLSIITPIDYDHQQYLGDTLLAIAREKAGIIKPGRPVVLAPQPQEARPAFPAAAIQVAAWGVENLVESPTGCSYLARLNETSIAIDCPLPGPHQVHNSLTAAVALHTLGLSPAAIRSGIAQTKWPGRLEIVRSSPLTYLDGAHNPGAARCLRQFIEKHFAGRPIWLVFGVMRDKDVPAIASELFPLAHRLILTRAQQDRSLEPEAIAALHPHPSTLLTQSVPEALSLLSQAPPDAVLFVTGSLFVVGEARPLLQ